MLLETHVCLNRFTVLLLCALLSAIAVTDQVAADTHVIARINHTGLTRPSGMAIDPSGIMFVEDGGGRFVWTLSKSDATVLQTYPLNATRFGARGLAHNAVTDEWFDSSRFSNDFLQRLDLQTGTVTNVGPTDPGLGFFNFLDLDVDPSGAMWLLSDRNGGSIWSVNQQTGAASLHRNLTGFHVTPVGTEYPVALAIDNAGQFFVASNGPSIQETTSFYSVDLASGLVTRLTSTSLTAPSYVVAFDQDPATGNWFAIEQRTSVSPAEWYLRGVTSVPEPSFGLFAFIAICRGLFRVRFLRQV